MPVNTPLVFFEELENTWNDALLVVDIDGTLVPDEEQAEISAAALNQLRRFSEHNHVLLCSNGGHQARNKRIAEISGVKLLETEHRKPSPKIRALLPTLSGGVIVIGDKLLTDGLFAKNIGAQFVKVRRRTSGNERVLVKVTYWIDDIIYSLLIRS
jgi:predicted HAD superfamily phosphohydrolase YqeG